MKSVIPPSNFCPMPGFTVEMEPTGHRDWGRRSPPEIMVCLHLLSACCMPGITPVTRFNPPATQRGGYSCYQIHFSDEETEMGEHSMTGSNCHNKKESWVRDSAWVCPTLESQRCLPSPGWLLEQRSAPAVRPFHPSFLQGGMSGLRRHSPHHF